MKTTYKVTLATVLGLGIAGMTLPLGALAKDGDHNSARQGGWHGDRHGGMGGGMRGLMRDGGFDFGALDTDGDGRITQAEMTARRAATIKELDADADGLLSADEIAAYQLRKAEDRAKDRAAQMIAALDTDGDGKISAPEMMMAHSDGSSRMFERLDANKDGAITQEEIDQRRAAHEKRRGDRRHDHHKNMGDGKTDAAKPDTGK